MTKTNYDSSLRVSKPTKNKVKLHCLNTDQKMVAWTEQTILNQLKKEQHGKDTK
jgi:hypothetical protein